MLGLVTTAGFKLKDWEHNKINHYHFIYELDEDN